MLRLTAFASAGVSGARLPRKSESAPSSPGWERADAHASMRRDEKPMPPVACGVVQLSTVTKWTGLLFRSLHSYLQRSELVVGNDHIGEVTEASVDAVHDLGRWERRGMGTT